MKSAKSRKRGTPPGPGGGWVQAIVLLFIGTVFGAIISPTLDPVVKRYVSPRLLYVARVLHITEPESSFAYHAEAAPKAVAEHDSNEVEFKVSITADDEAEGVEFCVQAPWYVTELSPPTIENPSNESYFMQPTSTKMSSLSDCWLVKRMKRNQPLYLLYIGKVRDKSQVERAVKEGLQVTDAGKGQHFRRASIDNGAGVHFAYSTGDISITPNIVETVHFHKFVPLKEFEKTDTAQLDAADSQGQSTDSMKELPPLHDPDLLATETRSVAITVLPSPNRIVSYTAPFVVVDGKDAKIRVTVTNIGAGVAHNFTIESARPKIVVSNPALLIPNEATGFVMTMNGMPANSQASQVDPFGDARIDRILKTGNSPEPVTVTDAAPLLRTESGELSHVVVTARMDSLPLLQAGEKVGGSVIPNPITAVRINGVNDSQTSRVAPDPDSVLSSGLSLDAELEVTTTHTPTVADTDLISPGVLFDLAQATRVNGTPANTYGTKLEGQDITNGVNISASQQQVQPNAEELEEVATHSNFDARGGQTTNVYDGTGNLTSTTDDLGFKTNYTYTATVGGQTTTAGQRGQSGPITITGLSSNFVQGTSQVSFGAGITVGTLTVTSSTSLTAQITIAPSAAVGSRTITVTTGTQIASLANGFTGQAGTPILTIVNPGGGQQGQSLPVMLTGQYTNWVQGTTTADFGAGITVNSVTVADATHLTAQLGFRAPGTYTLRTATDTLLSVSKDVDNSGISSVYIYDSAGNLLSASHGDNSGVSFTYTYDSAGNLLNPRTTVTTRLRPTPIAWAWNDSGSVLAYPIYVSDNSNPSRWGSAGNLSDDVPVFGDWNGDGRLNVGIYRNGLSFLDLKGNHRWKEASLGPGISVNTHPRFGLEPDKIFAATQERGARSTPITTSFERFRPDAVEHGSRHALIEALPSFLDDEIQRPVDTNRDGIANLRQLSDGSPHVITRTVRGSIRMTEPLTVRVIKTGGARIKVESTISPVQRSENGMRVRVINSGGARLKITSTARFLNTDAHPDSTAICGHAGPKCEGATLAKKKQQITTFGPVYPLVRQPLDVSRDVREEHRRAFPPSKQ